MCRFFAALSLISAPVEHCVGVFFLMEKLIDLSTFNLQMLGGIHANAWKKISMHGKN